MAKIIKKTPIGKQEVFDLIECTNHNYICNNIVSHNCDFSNKINVLEYLQQKCGSKFAVISINSLMKVKSAIKDVERVEYGEVRAETEFMCRKLPNPPQGIESLDWLMGYREKDTDIWIKGFVEENVPEAETLRTYAKDNKKIWDIVLGCLGILRQKSTHACGIIIADDDVTKYTPMTKVKDDVVTAFCPKGIEYKGLVKFDILGVQTLEAFRVSLNSIKEHCNETIKWEEFPHDPAVYDFIYRTKALIGIFQIGTTTMYPYVFSLLPKSTLELCNLVALVRPGTLDAPIKINETTTLKAADLYVKCVQGTQTPFYIHPDLKPILKSTQGINLFQEQTLEIFRKIGGFSYEEAEAARRGIGKKDKVLLIQEIEKLSNNIRKKGTWSEELIKELSELIVVSSSYSFNKSHAAACAVIAYNGMWLKYHYPLHFYKGLLTINTDDHDEIRNILQECGQYVLPPDITKSHYEEWTIEDSKLRAPLSLIKGVGLNTARNIQEVLGVL